MNKNYGKDAITSIVDSVEHAMGRRADIAVTGLRRAGKTVFVASLIRNLLARSRNPDVLPGFRPEIIGVKEEPAGIADLPPFQTEKYFRDLQADPPRWPKATDTISRTELKIRYKRARSITNPLGKDGILTLGIIDYPGEWLNDVQLLHLSFEEWSRQTLSRLRTGAISIVATDFLGFLSTANGNSRADIDLISRRGHELYKDALFKMRDELGLSFLQPGRFIMPDGGGDKPLLWFFPMEPPPEADKSGKDTLWATLAQRYKAYCDKIVTGFLRETFDRCNQQVVLVDLLTSLNGGQVVFDDACEALGTALDALGLGRSRWWKLLRMQHRKFDRVLFAVTKADHVPQSQRHALERLLENIIGDRISRDLTDGSRVQSMALASVLCTKDDKVLVDVGEVDVVVGKPIDSDKGLKIYPGVIPSDRPRSDYWSRTAIRYPIFSPPRLDAGAFGGIPNINLDRAINFILKDILK
jgi:predicted YcjX-like family ATPase